MKYLSILLSVVLMTFGLSVNSHAEQVKVYAGTQGESVNKPKTGTSKQQVRKQYGEPISQKAAVGNPPISSWQYPGFTVYFEYNHVIHAVSKR